MSCPESHSDPTKRPKSTRDKVYIWREIKDNPNLYCWIPASKKQVNMLKLDLEDVSVQDIPPLPDDFDQVMEDIVDKAEDMANKARLKKMDEGTDIISADDPLKYPIVKEFIQRKGLILYGGAAIDMWLPPDHKLYDPYSIPDYDMYSPSPWKDALELAHIMYDNGYKYTEIRSGIHKGTYKVFANFWPVADITYMPKDLFNKMKTRKFKGMKVAGVAKLLQDMYKELAKPYDDPGRWPKVARRLELLQMFHNPIKDSLRCSKDIFMKEDQNLPSPVPQLLEETQKFVTDNKLIYTGGMAYNTYMEIGGAPQRVATDHYDVLSENAPEQIQELLSKLLPIHKDLVVTTLHDLRFSLNTTRYAIFAKIGGKDEPICFMFQLNQCTPYKYLLGRYVVAIDYLKYMLWTLIGFGNDKKEVKDAKCKLKYLTKVQRLYYKMKKISPTDNSPFQRFVVNCKGPIGHGLKKVLFSRWIDRVERKKKGIRGTPIPPECENVPEENCEYPCNWNEKKQYCEAAPEGVYRIE